jgi:hypothetical protein
MKDLKEFSSLERALFNHDFNVLLLTVSENERPLRGLSGRMDWVFQGEISRFLKQDIIHGKSGEFTLIPVQKNQSSYILMIMGTGKTSHPGTRQKPSTEMLETLNRHLGSLKIKKVGISQSDFGDLSADSLKKQLSGVELWIGQ